LCRSTARVHAPAREDEELQKKKRGIFARFESSFNDKYERMLSWYNILRSGDGTTRLDGGAILAGVVLVLLVTVHFWACLLPAH